MPQVQMLRGFIQQRLSAAAEEIFELFERTIAEYEETLCRQQKLLDANIKPQVRLHRAGVQHVSTSKGHVPPEKHEWSPRPDQDGPTKLPHIKEEQEELWTSQGGPRLQGLEEADIIKFKFTPVLMKSEQHDEEKPHSSHFNYTLQMEKGSDYGGREPDRTFNPDSHLKPVTDDEVSRLSEPETDGSCDWEQTVQPQVNPGLNLPRNDYAYSTAKTPVGSSEFSTSFGIVQHQQEQSRIQTAQKTFKCSVCGKRYNWRKSLTTHMRSHTEGKSFNCTVCGKKYNWKASLTAHMRLHSEGKGFSCSFCQKAFPFKANFVRHMRVHTGEKPFCCSLCGKGFGDRATLRRHLRIHTGEKPFSCSVCGRSFIRLVHLKQHKCTGESSAGN